MAHYICTGGCRGVSQNPGVCETPNCQSHNKPLKECDCNDGKHHGVFEPRENPKDGLEDEGDDDELFE